MIGHHYAQPYPILLFCIVYDASAASARALFKTFGLSVIKFDQNQVALKWHLSFLKFLVETRIEQRNFQFSVKKPISDGHSYLGQAVVTSVSVSSTQDYFNNFQLSYSCVFICLKLLKNLLERWFAFTEE